MRKALLIIDRGSREPEVGHELLEISEKACARAGYDYSSYCFLEVIPPFIEEGLKTCIGNGADFVAIMPYFLYPGLKLKDTVKQSARMSLSMNINVAIAKPLSYHGTLADVIIERISELKVQNQLDISDAECDILLIGHGSSDKRAREAFIFTADSLSPSYRNVNFCFLELDRPNIEEGIRRSLLLKPRVLLMMPYFLHKGAHIKNDVVKEVAAALAKFEFEHAFMARHFGVDEKMINLVVERIKEAEERRFGRRQDSRRQAG